MVRLQRFYNLLFVFITCSSLNSTMVRLQLLRPCSLCRKPCSLNSTMVRLQLHSEDVSVRLKLKSQFHYGSITTWVLRGQKWSFTQVSIPLWFDYNPFRIVYSNIRYCKSQFHYGSITTL